MQSFTASVFSKSVRLVMQGWTAAMPRSRCWLISYLADSRSVPWSCQGAWFHALRFSAPLLPGAAWLPSSRLALLLLAGRCVCVYDEVYVLVYILLLAPLLPGAAWLPSSRLALLRLAGRCVCVYDEVYVLVYILFLAPLLPGAAWLPSSRLALLRLAGRCVCVCDEVCMCFECGIPQLHCCSLLRGNFCSRSAWSRLSGRCVCVCALMKCVCTLSAAIYII